MQTQEMKTVLDAKLNELTSRRIGRDDIAIEKNADDMDGIQQAGDRTLALESLSRRWETTTLISEALKRIETDTYGICEECDEPISQKRLAALPWAKFCITCQDVHDREATDARMERVA